MPINVTCACGAAYNIKDDFAGAQVACPKCGAAINVPALPPAPPVNAQAGDSVFARDKFLLNQRHMAISEKYTVADENGAPLLYVERPRYAIMTLLAAIVGVVVAVVCYMGGSIPVYLMKQAGLPMLVLALAAYAVIFGSGFAGYVAALSIIPKRHITVYRDDSRGEVLLKVLQDSRIQILTSAFTVVDDKEQVVAYIYKKYLHNIFRKRWYCHGADEAPLFVAKEDSFILSILRRFLGSFFGLLRTDFIFLDRADNVLGEFNRRMTLLDRYVLDMTPDHLRKVDRRIALAMGVLLDTGEKR